MLLVACTGLLQSITQHTLLRPGYAASSKNHLLRHVPQDLVHSLPGINLHLLCNAGPLQILPTPVCNIVVKLQGEQCHLQGRVPFVEGLSVTWACSEWVASMSIQSCSRSSALCRGGRDSHCEQLAKRDEVCALWVTN